MHRSHSVGVKAVETFEWRIATTTDPDTQYLVA